VVVEACAVTSLTVVVAVDVGKTEFAFSVSDTSRRLLLKPRTGCPMTAPSLRQVIGDIQTVLSPGAMVKVGIEAAGHYHRPLLAAGSWPAGWELLELNPGHVTEQRKVLGKRTIKTDVIDLQAMTELLLAGRGLPVRDRSVVLTELTAWSAHRTGRVALRTATKNQLLGQLDRTFPGLTLALPDVLGTRVGRLVATEFADPARLAALGTSGFIRFGATRSLQIRKPTADKLIQAAKDALPTRDAPVARAVLAADLTLLTDLDAQISHATTQLARLVPASPFAPLLTVSGWAAVRVGNYGGALGDPSRVRQLPADLPNRRAQPDPVRVRRQAPRLPDQPRGQRRAPPCPDRPRHRAVAHRPSRQGPPPCATSQRQERARDRLRHGQPRQPDRVRSCAPPAAL